MLRKCTLLLSVIFQKRFITHTSTHKKKVTSSCQIGNVMSKYVKLRTISIMENFLEICNIG